MGRRLALVASVLALGAACAKVAGIDELSIGACKGGVCVDEGGTSDQTVPGDENTTPPNEAGTFDSSKPCPGNHGPDMVRVGNSANNFCIDSSEVTVKQYTEFKTAKGADMSGQPPECAWNTSYTALAGGTDEIPISGVDWCDAVAYCKWAGKRLCGKHADGTHTGPVPITGLADFNTHEWFLACSNIGQLRYPYGSLQQPTSCNTGENDAGRTLAVKSKPSCQGGFVGVYDMVGNVWEWYDGPCLPPDGGTDGGPAKDICFVKGGGFLNVNSDASTIDCRVDGLGAARDRVSIDIGFRCCSD